ncbi:PspC domain-containing protein [Corynebacterium mendelii]|uniref:PspC domain-containing protein n=1 Tax=Corynebacterium mendelii TaxID=2765362 RepID=A0A939DZE4_9CORY|nr:ATP-binding protein [Corynebacterium mendelii]MBN9644065.1 PspC domain-containing protein [Corynebacterium mendelii]
MTMTPPQQRPVVYRARDGRVIAGVAQGIADHLDISVTGVRILLVVAGVAGGAGVLFYVLAWWMIPQAPVDVNRHLAPGRRASVDGDTYYANTSRHSADPGVPRPVGAESDPATGPGTGGTGCSAGGRGERCFNRGTSLTEAKKQFGRLSRWASERKTGLLLVAVAAAVAVVVLGSMGISAFAAGSLGVVALGAAVVWLAGDWADGKRSPGFVAGAVIAGMALFLAGGVLVAVNWESEQFAGSAVIAVVVTFTGTAFLALPLVVRLWEQLSKERQAAALEAQRLEIASRLHDSVLQTLALIQKRAGDNREVALLARRQERQLRQWLFGSEVNLSAGAGTVKAAVELACAEVEDAYGIRINAVTVGADVELSDNAQAVVLAAREAMVNAAKHSGADCVDVYAECLAGELSIYVRDRGRGFDKNTVGAGRHGLAESVIGRMERAGGTATIESAPGEGTEITVTIAL